MTELRARLHGEFQPIQPGLPMSRLRGQKPHKNIYDYVKKISAPVAEVKFQPGQGRPGSRLNGLKISQVNVFSPG